MGLPTIPQDAAPAYDDGYHDHPIVQCLRARAVSREPGVCFSASKTNVMTSMRLFRKTMLSSKRNMTTTTRPTALPQRSQVS